MNTWYWFCLNCLTAIGKLHYVVMFYIMRKTVNYFVNNADKADI